MHVDTLGIDHDGSSLFACTVTVALGGKGGTGLSISKCPVARAAVLTPHNATRERACEVRRLAMVSKTLHSQRLF